ncbi:hypothetical protein ACFLSJ_02165 [Verrucomicrobiota bacterium]
MKRGGALRTVPSERESKEDLLWDSLVDESWNVLEAEVTSAMAVTSASVSLLTTIVGVMWLLFLLPANDAKKSNSDEVILSPATVEVKFTVGSRANAWIRGAARSRASPASG